jgi:hypothetical protein
LRTLKSLTKKKTELNLICKKLTGVFGLVIFLSMPTSLFLLMKEKYTLAEKEREVCLKSLPAQQTKIPVKVYIIDQLYRHILCIK